MFIRLFFIALTFVLAACARTPDSTPPAAAKSSAAESTAPATPTHVSENAGTPSANTIAWYPGEVDAAFAQAKQSDRPVFLYWGAVWCPPCNQVKATIFNRQDFIERSRFFIPVYIDGDQPRGQKLGARFHVTGYPTMILFRPDGQEITRLPGEVDADAYMRVLTMAMNGARPIKATLAAALSTQAKSRASLSAQDWHMLAYYSWPVDDEQLLPEAMLPSALHRLALTCPQNLPEAAQRLRLQTLVAQAKAKDATAQPEMSAAALAQVLHDEKRVHENFDLLTAYADDIAGYITPAHSRERSELVAVWNAALAPLVSDASFSAADQLTALGAQVALAKLDTLTGKLPENLLRRVRDEVARADHETTDAYARQSVMSAAADVLADAGLIGESDTLLHAELTRSHSPYYFMLHLAANAEKRGDTLSALDWHEKAYTAARGPATRLQWGASYVSALVELAPQDSARIERAAQSVIGELDPAPDTFYDRNRRSLERITDKLAAWNAQHKHEATLRRLRAQMSQVCGKLPQHDPARTTCRNVLRARA